ncbi:MAG TPA: iron ABC transporter permease [Nitrosomonas nitrosa]|nr:iron ABC transporter permease [Nitrosomonas nitrosa]HBZ30085.1 iron ABC transporter permease [Nitrosomonas nitrosa]
MRLFCFFLLLAAGSLLVGIGFGSVSIPLNGIMQALVTPAHDPVSQIIWQLRIPRVLSAFACGGLLAIAGALLQVLLRNPLADPYILGVSGGAAVGALTAMMLGWGPILVNLTSLVGALTIITIVFGLSFWVGNWNLYRLLLIGVVLSVGCTAITTLILTLSPASDVKGMLFWLMGDISRAETLLPVWLPLIIVTTVSLLLSGQLNVLNIGQTKAQTLGIAVLPLQIGVYFMASLATAAALMQVGAIGFIGLLTPHAVRLLGVSDHRWLLPLVILLGGSFLTLADTLARTAWAPQQLPVGILIALLGVPALLFLLTRK